MDWECLSYNFSISEVFFEKYIDKVNWWYLSENTSISEFFFEKHLDKVNWEFLSGNTFSIYIKNKIKKTKYYDFDFMWKIYI